MCSLRVCIPGEILRAEAGERNESCAVNHSLPHRRRGETHAESNNCIQIKHHWNMPFKSDTSPPARMQSAAQMLHWMKGFLTQAEWRIPTLLFPHTLTFHKQSDFLSELFCSLAYLFPQTCTYDCQSWKRWRERMQNERVVIQRHTVILIPPPLKPLKPALSPSLFHIPTLS